MNEKQRTALTKLCERYDDVTFNPDDFRPVFDLPKGWVAGWVTDSHGVGRLYVGCDPEGRISS